MTMGKDPIPQGGGLGTEAMAPALGHDPLGGTGGSAGGGTRAGEGEPDGEQIDGTAADAEVLAAPDRPGREQDEEIATEAAALGDVDGTLSDAKRGHKGGAGTPTMGSPSAASEFTSVREPIRIPAGSAAPRRSASRAVRVPKAPEAPEATGANERNSRLLISPRIPL
jgi:hypothetical protein